jgi:hypothetical protein
MGFDFGFSTSRVMLVTQQLLAACAAKTNAFIMLERASASIGALVSGVLMRTILPTSASTSFASTSNFLDHECRDKEG